MNKVLRVGEGLIPIGLVKKRVHWKHVCKGKGHVRREREGGQMPAKERCLIRNQPRRHLGLEHPASKTVRK